MQFSTVFGVIATASLAMAAAVPNKATGYSNAADKPAYSEGPTGETSGQPSGGNQHPPLGSSCGANQEKVSCCNSSNTGKFSSFVPFNKILGGDCALSSAGGSCRQTVACCPTTQNSSGFSIINISNVCMPIAF